MPGAQQKGKGRTWRIPAEAVEAWIANHATAEVSDTNIEPGEPPIKPKADLQTSPTPGPPVWWERFRYNPWIFYPTVVIGILITVTALVAGLISAGADIGPARQQLQEWGLLRQFPTATPDETLILIATFHHTEGVVDTDVHNEIRRAIQVAASEAGLSNLRVEVEPTRLTADDRTGAEGLANRYSANMIIWGSDTGIRITVNYLNLKQPDFAASEVQISETERTQLANPSAYAEFIIDDLPDQLTFLSLFAVGHAYYSQANYPEAIRVIEKAVVSLPTDVNPPEGTDDAYFRLGWLYQRPNGNLKQAIQDYTRAIELNPNYVEAYNNRGGAYAASGDLEQAFQDFTKAIELNPNYAEAYYNRGGAYADSGDREQAIQDYTRAIELNPNYVEAYNNRGIVYGTSGDLEQAIQDYTRAIELNPNYAEAYNNRGIVYGTSGDLEQAIQDYTKAVELKPNYAVAYGNRGSLINSLATGSTLFRILKGTSN